MLVSRRGKLPRNITAMRESAETFVGEHNFHAFTSQHGDLDLEIDHDQPTNQPLRKNVQIDMAGSLVMNFGKCTF